MKTLILKNKIYMDPESLGDPDPQDPEIKSQFQKIFTELEKNEDAEHIDLSGNWITEFELEQIAAVLSLHKNLTTLDLKYNRLGFAAIPHIKKVIAEHPHLQRLYLANNVFDDQAIRSLLDNNEEGISARLKALDIKFWGNAITEVGIELAYGKVSFDTLSSALAYNKVTTFAKEKYRKLISEQMAYSVNSAPLIYSGSVLGQEPLDEKARTPEVKSPPTVTISPKKY